jgi:hypothetical protein
MNDFKQELWETQFGFFYYNDHEIFTASPEELERRAQEYAATGITQVITFSITHFRWSFQRSWGTIDAALERIVKAFRKHGVKVTEHHSANYIFAPRDRDGYELMSLRFSCRNSAIARWPGFEEDFDLERSAGNNVPIKSLLQIDGRSGEPIYLKHYAAHLMCPNNPDFVKLYLGYLENHIYPLGVDGIMTDDISNRCACVHCRKLYRERTGFDLPECGEDWSGWELDKDSPSYVAWLKFRLDSCNEFHRAVKQHYEKLGLRLLRPNYVATAVSFTYFECLQNFDDLPALDWAFQENNFSDIIRYSWPEWLVEAGHRRMVAANRDIPAMSMFYPDREDTVRFGWALAMNWGQKYLGTTHNAAVDQNQFEKPLRAFEREHFSLLNKTSSLATLAFYDSALNRIIYSGYNQRSAPILSSWVQACAHHNIPWTMINESELGNLNRYDAIVLPEVACLSQEEVAALLLFAQAGGRLILIGDCGTMNKDGSRRRFPFVATNANTLVLRRDEVALTVEKRAAIPARWNKTGEELRSPANGWRLLTASEKEARRQIINVLKKAMPNGFGLEVDNAPEDLLVTPYAADKGKVAIHLTNACETLTMPAANGIGHSDRIPFPEMGDPVEIRLSKPEGWSSSQARQCLLHTPAPQQDHPVGLCRGGGHHRHNRARQLLFLLWVDRTLRGFSRKGMTEPLLDRIIFSKIISAFFSTQRGSICT